MTATVAILGRPNVGKSTLFNRLVGRRLALVDDQPGVTRDRREGEVLLYGLRFTAIDTAGLEEAFDDSLEARMRAQTEKAAAEADVVLLLIDARAGVTRMDEHFAEWLRRMATPVVVVANKAEGRAGETGRLEAYGLGLGDPIPVSAEHGEGLADLHEALLPLIGDSAKGDAKDRTEEDDERPLKLAIVGRPNVGKSTLVNKLIGEERLLTGPEAGITRDAIAVSWDYRGQPIELVDTAGLRRRSKVDAKIEKLSVGDSLRTIRFAEIVVLVVESDAPMERQDLTIARQVLDEGRALVIAVNKWDLCEDKQATLRGLRDRLTRSLPQSKGVPVVTLSALTGHNLRRLMDEVLACYEVWNRRVPTGALNRWLDAVGASHPPPMKAGRPNRLKYITQAKGRPPTFALFCSHPDALPDSYLRYLENSLREAFELPGTPIRIHPRRGKNPYADKPRKRPSASKRKSSSQGKRKRASR